MSKYLNYRLVINHI